jgi:transposase
MHFITNNLFNINYNLDKFKCQAESSFVGIVQYKASLLGKNVIFCPRFAPSSKACSCGHINEKLTLSERNWQCSVCFATHDRDLLAAGNIKHFALQAIAIDTKMVETSPC